MFMQPNYSTIKSSNSTVKLTTLENENYENELSSLDGDLLVFRLRLLIESLVSNETILSVKGMHRNTKAPSFAPPKLFDVIHVAAVCK